MELSVKLLAIFCFQTVNGRVTGRNSATFYAKVARFSVVSHRLFSRI